MERRAAARTDEIIPFAIDNEAPEPHHACDVRNEAASRPPLPIAVRHRADPTTQLVGRCSEDPAHPSPRDAQMAINGKLAVGIVAIAPCMLGEGA